MTRVEHERTRARENPSGSSPRVDLEEAARLWQLLGHNLPDGAGVSVCTPAGRGFRVFADTTTLEEYLDGVQRAASTKAHALYVSVNAYDLEALEELRATKPSARGTKREIAATLAVVADLDMAHGKHSAEKPYPDESNVEELLDGLPAPSLVVDSGGGRHVWWILTEPVTDSTTAQAARMSVRNILHRNATRLGVHVDLGVTTDAARILRVPGSTNHKRPEDPRPVRILSEGAPVELAQLVDLEEVPERSTAERMTPERPTSTTTDRSSATSTERPTSSTFTAPDRTGWVSEAVARLEEGVSWSDLLGSHGWEHVGTDSEGEHFRRPGGENVKSATVHRDTGRLMVWSEASAFGDPMGSSGQRRTFDKLDAAVILDGGTPDGAGRVEWLRRHGYAPTLENRGSRTAANGRTGTPEGDYPGADSQAGTDLEGVEELDEGPSSWEPIDLEAYLDGSYTPPVADLMPRTDGVGLLYRGRVHSLHGESESGKSLVAQAETVRVLVEGGRVLMVDFESDADEVVPRLLRMGAPAQAIRERFHYVHPDGSPFLTRNLEAYDNLTRNTYDLAVVDGVTDALGIWSNGTASSGDNDAVSAFMRGFPRKLARSTGAAVVLIDHVVKDSEARGRYAIGGQAKLAALDGAAYTVEVAEVIGLGMRGVLVLRIAKDRGGTVRPHCSNWRKSDRTQEAARVVIDSTVEGSTVVTFDPPRQALDEGGTFRPTHLMERVSRTLEEAGEALSLRNLKDMVTGKAEAVTAAVSVLVTEGYVKREAGARNAQLHTSVKPYRETSDPESDRHVSALPGGVSNSSTGSQEPENRSSSSTPSTSSVTGSRSKDRGTGTHSISQDRPIPGTGREPVGNRSGSESTSCPHGMPGGAEPDLFVGGALACTECRAEAEGVA